MKTIALRFSENFAPECGTIKAHEELIIKNGFVWYGKLGNKISANISETIINNNVSRILLINSGKQNRYWAYISEISYEVPDIEFIPEYYRYNTDKFKTWFKVERFEEAPKDIMQNCYVTSSKAVLSEASKHSMSPYFKIECEVNK